MSLSAVPFRSRLRVLVERFVALVAAVLAFQAWILDGLPVPCQVHGGSMAETLLGAHHEVTCTDCAFNFVCDADPGPGEAPITCPNCGYYGLRVEGRPAAGDRLLIDRSAFYFRGPQRWDVVAFRRPTQGSALAVKRIAGLPGETVRIHNGDVYVDGQVQRKGLLQQRAMRVLVHDAGFQPRLEPAPRSRWHSAEKWSQWTWAGNRCAHVSIPESEQVDWLVYSHWRRRLGGSGEVVPGPITDLCGYNQGRPRREEDLHPVADVMLSVRIADVSGSGPLVLRASDGREEFQTIVNIGGGRYSVLQNGESVPGAAGKLPAAAKGMLLEVSLFDQQFLLAMNGQTMVARAYGRPEGSAAPTFEPLAVGVKGPGVLLQDLRVYRDVYYTPHVEGVNRIDVEKGVILGAGQYFLLGDNSPISEDSRTWGEGPAVDERWFIGRPWMVLLPARSTKIGSRQFQVPDPERIRYIR